MIKDSAKFELLQVNFTILSDAITAFEPGCMTQQTNKLREDKSCESNENKIFTQLMHFFFCFCHWQHLLVTTLNVRTYYS